VEPHKKERLLPDGSVELVMNLRDEVVRVYDGEDPGRSHTFGHAVVGGPHSSFFVIDTDQQENLVGVHFKPGGAFPFLGPPADELHNLHVGLEDLWGALARRLRERLLEAPDEPRKARIVEEVLLERAGRSLDRHPAVVFALGHFQRVPHVRTISQVTRQIGLSPHRFIQVFREEVGLTPKLFCRVRRFHEAIRRAHRQERVDWIDLALGCGYFDQAHFIKDFQAFSGLNPSTWLVQRTDHLNHVPLA
jgi:AraC-like DNA-binding protein